MASKDCDACGQPLKKGRHKLPPEEREKLAWARCPKCSGDGEPTCEVDGRVRHRCSCGVYWGEPLND